MNQSLLGDGMKVRVWVTFQTQIPYVLDVDSPDPETIKEKLMEKDPSEWESDPDLYEQLGFNWKDCVSKIDEEDIEVLEE